MGLIVSGDQELSNDYYLKYGTGYFRAADDAPDSAAQANGSTLGTEVAAQLGKSLPACMTSASAVLTVSWETSTEMTRRIPIRS